MQAKKRKHPEERRADIVQAASVIARGEGLDSLTLRRVADALGIVPGLVNHYFPDVNDLAAAAFGHTVAAERNALFAALNEADPPRAQMRALLAGLLRETSGDISLLWLDAWQAARRRPALHAEVTRQMRLWQDELAALILRGGFRVADPAATALRLLALIDGLSVQAAMRDSVAYSTVRGMVIAVSERELGLRAGSLPGHMAHHHEG